MTGKEIKERGLPLFIKIYGDTMTNKKGSLALVALVLSMILMLGIPATADTENTQPQLPHAFYGKVEINSIPANAGLAVEARGTGVLSNVVNTSSSGSFGGINFTEQKLIVQGSIEPGDPVYFFVSGQQAEVWDVAKGGPWAANYSYTPGEVTELILRIASQPLAGQPIAATPTDQVPAGSGGSGSGFTGPGISQPSVVETFLPGENIGNITAAGQSGEPTPVQGEVQPGQTSEGSAPVIPATTASTGMLGPAGAIIVLAVLSGILAYMNRKQS